jgi:hypothetical protein
MKNPCKHALMTASLSLAMMFPNLVSAESNFDSGALGLTAKASVDFSISIPRILFFQVGTPGAGNIDLIDFTLAAADVGSGAAVNGTGGDATGGAVNVNVRSNAGQVSIAHDSNGISLTDGTNNIPFTEIVTASSNIAGLDAPVLGGPVVPITPTVVGSLTNETAVWTYTYANSNVLAASTYNGTVTYTASAP